MSENFSWTLVKSLWMREPKSWVTPATIGMVQRASRVSPPWMRAMKNSARPR